MMSATYDDGEEYDYDVDDGCNHEDNDLDIITGRCHCYRCGESWYASDAEMLIAADHQAEYARWEDEENRRQWWRDLWGRIAAPFRRLRSRHQRHQPDTGDEIPF